MDGHDGGAESKTRKMLVGMSSNLYYTVWFQQLGMCEDCSAAKMCPQIVFLFGILLEVVQLLTFAIGTQYHYNADVIRQITIGIFATIFPLWDTTNFGPVNYLVYAIFVYVATAVCLTTLVLGALLMGRKLQSSMMEVSSVVGIVGQSLSSWLYLPLMHLFLAGLGCEDASDNQRHVMHFPNEECHSPIHLATMTISIVSLIALFAIMIVMVSMMGDVRQAAAHLRSRPHNQIELAHYLIITGLVIAHHLLIPYGYNQVNAILVAVGMIITMALHSYGLPFYQHTMNIIRVVAAMTTLVAALVNFVAELWGSGLREKSEFVDAHLNSFMLAIFVPFAALVGYALGDLRPCSELRGKLENLLHTGTVPQHEALFPFPKSRLTHDLKFTAPRFQLLEGDILAEYEDLMFNTRGRSSNLGGFPGEGGSLGGGSSSSAGKQQPFQSTDVSGGRGNNPVGVLSAAEAFANQLKMNEEAEMERRAYRIATHCQILVPYIKRIRIPWDAEMSTRFVKLQSDVTGLPASPFVVAFASRIFIKCLILWRASGIIKCAFANFLYSRTKRFRLALDLVEEVDGQLDGVHDIMTLYISHKVGHEIRDLSGIRDEVRTVALNRARYSHKEALVDMGHFWSKLIESRSDIVGLALICSHITDRRIKAQFEYERFLLTQRPDGVVLNMYAAFLESVIGDDLATEEFKNLAAFAAEEKRARMMKRGGQSTISFGVGTATSRATAKLIENLHDANEIDRRAQNETFSATVSARTLMRIISVFLVIVGAMSITAFVLQRVRLSDEAEAIRQIRRIGEVRASVEKQRYLIMIANEVKLDCFVRTANSTQSTTSSAGSTLSVPLIEQLVVTSSSSSSSATTASSTASSLLLCSDADFLEAVKALGDEEVIMRGVFNKATIGTDKDSNGGAMIKRIAMQAITERSVPLRTPSYSEVFNVQPSPFVVADIPGIASTVVRTGTFSQFSQSAADAVTMATESPWISITILSQKVTEAINRMTSGTVYGEAFAWVTSADNVAYVGEGMTRFIEGIKADVRYEGFTYLGATIGLFILILLFIAATYYAFFTNLQRAALSQMHRLQLFTLVPYSSQEDLLLKARSALDRFERMTVDGEEDSANALNVEDDEDEGGNNNGDNNTHSPHDAFDENVNQFNGIAAGRANAVVHHRLPSMGQDPWASQDFNTASSPAMNAAKIPVSPVMGGGGGGGVLNSIHPMGLMVSSHPSNNSSSAVTPSKSASQGGNRHSLRAGHNPLLPPSLPAALHNQSGPTIAAPMPPSASLWYRAAAGGGAVEAGEAFVDPTIAANSIMLLAASPSSAEQQKLMMFPEAKGVRRMRMFSTTTGGGQSLTAGGGGIGSGRGGSLNGRTLGGISSNSNTLAPNQGAAGMFRLGIKSCLKAQSNTALATNGGPFGNTHGQQQQHQQRLNNNNNNPSGGGQGGIKRRVTFKIEGEGITAPGVASNLGGRQSPAPMTSPNHGGGGGSGSGGGETPKRKLKEKYEPIPEGIVAEYEQSIRQAQREADEESERERVRSEKVIFGGLRSYQMGRKRAMEISRQQSDNSQWDVSSLSMWLRMLILVPILVALLCTGCGLSIASEVWQREAESVRVATAATDLVSQLRELQMETILFINSGRLEHYHSMMSRLQNREFFAGPMRAISRSKAIIPDTASHVINLQRISERIIYDMVAAMCIAGRAITSSTAEENNARGITSVAVDDVPVLSGVSWISTGVDEAFAKTFPPAVTDPLGYAIPSLAVLRNNYISYYRHRLHFDEIVRLWENNKLLLNNSNATNSSAILNFSRPVFASRFHTLSQFLAMSLEAHANRSYATRLADTRTSDEKLEDAARRIEQAQAIAANNKRLSEAIRAPFAVAEAEDDTPSCSGGSGGGGEGCGSGETLKRRFMPAAAASSAGASATTIELTNPFELILSEEDPAQHFVDGSWLSLLNMSNLLINNTEEMLTFARLRITSKKVSDDFNQIGDYLAELLSSHSFMKQYEENRKLKFNTVTDPLRSSDRSSSIVITASSTQTTRKVDPNTQASWSSGSSPTSTSASSSSSGGTLTSAGSSTAVSGGVMIGRFGVSDEALMERYGAIQMPGLIGVGSNVYQTAQILIFIGFACSCVSLVILALTFLISLTRQARRCLSLRRWRPPNALEFSYFVFVGIGLTLMATAVGLTAALLPSQFAVEDLHDSLMSGLKAYEQTERQFYQVFVNQPGIIMAIPTEASTSVLKYFELYHQSGAVGSVGTDSAHDGDFNPPDGLGMAPWLNQLADALDDIAATNGNKRVDGSAFRAFRSDIDTQVVPALAALARIQDVGIYLKRSADLKCFEEDKYRRNNETVPPPQAIRIPSPPPSPPFINDYNMATELQASADLSRFTDFTFLRYSTPAQDIRDHTSDELVNMARHALFGSRGLFYMRQAAATLRKNVFVDLLKASMDAASDRADDVESTLTVVCGLLATCVIVAAILFVIPWAMYIFSTRKGIAKANGLIQVLFKHTLHWCQLALIVLVLFVGAQFTLFFLSKGVAEDGADIVDKAFQRETIVAQCLADAIHLRDSARNANVFEAMARSSRLKANAGILRELRNTLYYNGNGGGGGRYGRTRVLSDLQKKITFDGDNALDRLHTDWLATITALSSASYTIVKVSSDRNVTKIAKMLLQQAPSSASTTTPTTSVGFDYWTPIPTVNYSSATAPDYLTEFIHNNAYLEVIDTHVATLKQSIDPLMSALRRSNAAFVSDVHLAIDSTLAPDIVLLITILVLVVVELRIVFRPVGSMLLEQETGTRLLLAMIPSVVREMIPRLQLYLDTGDLSDTSTDAEAHQLSEDIITRFKDAWQRGDVTEQCFAILDTDEEHGFVVIDAEGIVQHVNDAIQGLLGFTNSDIAGINVGEMMEEPLRSNHNMYIRRYLVSGNPRVVGTGRDTVALSKNGERVPIYLQVFDAVRDDGSMYFIGQIDRYVGGGGLKGGQGGLGGGYY